MFKRFQIKKVCEVYLADNVQVTDVLETFTWVFCSLLFQKRVDLLQLMMNAHKESRNNDTEHDQEFHDAHGATERKGILTLL